MKTLVVDSEQLFARLTKTKLEKWGHTVTIESSGSDAMKRIDKEPFRVVIMDLDLPGMSGQDLCRHIRALKRPRYTYIIFYTAKSDKDSLMAGFEAGADDYLIKPFNSFELQRRLKNGKRFLNLEDELREGGGTDAMTGLVNYASFRQFFRVILAESRRLERMGVPEHMGALMFIRVEDVNRISEERGFEPAQKLMVEIAKVLNGLIRMSDLVAKISDDEFCMLLQNTYWDKCAVVAEKITNQVSSLVIVVDDLEMRPKVSVATVNYPVPDLTSDQILTEGERIPFEQSAQRASS